MQSKDYILLTRCLKGAESVSEVLNKLCSELKADNPKFNIDKFASAVGEIRRPEVNCVYNGSIIIIKDGVAEENIPFIEGDEAENIFYEKIMEYIGESTYVEDSIDTWIEDGYVSLDNNSLIIIISWYTK